MQFIFIYINFLLPKKFLDVNSSDICFVCRGQAQREFKVEVEAIGKVRHKNLVGLVGYCAEGPQR